MYYSIVLSSLSRAKHIKQSAHVCLKEDEDTSSPAEEVPSAKNESSERILEKVGFVPYIWSRSFIYVIVSKQFLPLMNLVG